MTTNTLVAALVLSVFTLAVTLFVRTRGRDGLEIAGYGDGLVAVDGARILMPVEVGSVSPTGEYMAWFYQSDLWVYSNRRGGWKVDLTPHGCVKPLEFNWHEGDSMLVVTFPPIEAALPGMESEAQTQHTIRLE
jgi:hypothetical protein